MKIKSNKSYSELIVYYINKWVSILGLNDWSIDYKICKSVKDMDNALANVYDDSTLRYAKITYGPKSIIDKDSFRNLEQITIHELLHVYFSELTPDDQDTVTYKVLHRKIEMLAMALWKSQGGSAKFDTKIDTCKNMDTKV